MADQERPRDDATASNTWGKRFEVSSNEEAEAQNAVDQLYGHVVQQLQAGVGPGDVKKQLIADGLNEETADTVVYNSVKAISDINKEAGKKNMIFGGLWCLGGGFITYATMAAAENGGGYVITWGAILFGAIQFFRGLSQYTTA